MKHPPTEAQLSIIPGLYKTESIPTEDKIIHAHFQIFDSHWYIIEWDSVDTMFGFCILTGDLQNSEYGYVSLEDLKQIKIHGIYEVEFDTNWVPTPAGEVELIRDGGGIFSSTDSAPDRDPWTWYSLQSQPNT